MFWLYPVTTRTAPTERLLEYGRQGYIRTDMDPELLCALLLTDGDFRGFVTFAYGLQSPVDFAAVLAVAIQPIAILRPAGGVVIVGDGFVQLASDALLGVSSCHLSSGSRSPSSVSMRFCILWRDRSISFDV